MAGPSDPYDDRSDQEKELAEEEKYLEDDTTKTTIMTMNNIPKFIVVDGPDGSGKTTIIKHMVDMLKVELPDAKIVVGRGLGSGNAAEAIRSTMMNKEINKTSNYEIYGAIMCLIDCYETFVLPNIKNGNIVILDRYVPSYYAYQVTARDSEMALTMLKDVFNVPFTLQPDLYINTYCSVDNSIKRMNGRNDNNYFDEEGRIFKTLLLKGYEEFFAKEHMFHTCKPSKVIKLDTNPEWPDVYKELVNIVHKQVLKKGINMVDIDKAVNKFMGMPLTKDFNPDCGISFTHKPDAMDCMCHLDQQVQISLQLNNLKIF